MTRVPFSAEWYHCTFLGCGFVVKSWRRGLEGVLLVTSNKRTNESQDGGELSIFLEKVKKLLNSYKAAFFLLNGLRVGVQTLVPEDNIRPSR
jgi:hypothetical protein